MKILVFSDSHRSRREMFRAVDAQNPDMLIHLGDIQPDAEQLGMAYPKLPLVSVPGNCDGWTMEPAVRQFTLEGHTVLLSHGHIWQVKRGYSVAIDRARKAGAELLLFGHTHRAYCQEESGLWILNPGASRSSYGMILLDREHIQCSILPAE